MNIQKYLAFIMTVEYGSFTKAAEALSYTQSGVSRMISDLEKEWKLSLLERDRAGVRLTSDGLKLLPLAKEVCAGYRKLQMQVDELNGLQSGLIRIGTFSSVAIHWLPKIIQKFQQDYPGIDYDLQLGYYPDIEQWIAEGSVDCGFVRLPTNPEFETIELQKDELLVVLPDSHPLAGREKIPIRELCGYPFMLMEKGVHAEITELFESSGVKPNVHFSSLDDQVVLSMVERGLCISIMHSLMLQRIPYRVVTRPLETPAYRTIALALKSSRSASVAVKKFLDYLQYR